MPRQAYSGTKVSAAKSTEQINKILRKWNATKIAWENDILNGITILRFRWATNDDIELVARLSLVTGEPDQEMTEKQFEKWRDGEQRRILRVTHYWLKSQFEAVEAGLFDADEVMLPWLEGKNGQTVAEMVCPKLKALGSGTTLQLGGKT